MQETKDLKAQAREQTARASRTRRRPGSRRSRTFRPRATCSSRTARSTRRRSRTFMKAAIEFDTWSEDHAGAAAGPAEAADEDAVRQDRRRQSGGRASRRGIDLVLADQRPELPENLDRSTSSSFARAEPAATCCTPRQGRHQQRVIATLDSKYKAGGGTPPAPATGAGAQRRRRRAWNGRRHPAPATGAGSGAGDEVRTQLIHPRGGSVDASSHARRHRRRSCNARHRRRSAIAR